MAGPILTRCAQLECLALDHIAGAVHDATLHAMLDSGFLYRAKGLVLRMRFRNHRMVTDLTALNNVERLLKENAVPWVVLETHLSNYSNSGEPVELKRMRQTFGFGAWA